MKKQSKNIFIIVGIIIVITIVIIWGIILNKKVEINKQEQENIKIDEYNFGELEKVKKVLDGLDKNSYKFDNLKEFNKEFHQNIKPIKNCYYVSNNNGNQPYIFGFELYSDKYKEKNKSLYRGEYIEKFRNLYKSDYGSNYYFYPKYNLSFINFCSGGDICDDLSLIKVESTILNPCK